MKVNIYHLNKVLMISDAGSVSQYNMRDMRIFDIKSEFFSNIDDIVNQWLKGLDNYHLIFEDDNAFMSFLMGYLMNKFSVMQAAGGLIRHFQKGYLFIYKRGYWDLPKGKVDKGETMEQAAVRECMEETGITGLSIEKNLGLTFHIFEQKEKYILKITQWYLMNTLDNQPLVPQVEEDIEKVEWIDNEKMLIDESFKTYPSIREVMKRCGVI